MAQDSGLMDPKQCIPEEISGLMEIAPVETFGFVQRRTYRVAPTNFTQHDGIIDFYTDADSSQMTSSTMILDTEVYLDGFDAGDKDKAMCAGVNMLAHSYNTCSELVFSLGLVGGHLGFLLISGHFNFNGSFICHTQCSVEFSWKADWVCCQWTMLPLMLCIRKPHSHSTGNITPIS
jgi:hypothetical protein